VQNLASLIEALALNEAQADELRDLAQRVAIAPPRVPRMPDEQDQESDRFGGLTDGLRELPSTVVSALRDFLSECVGTPEETWPDPSAAERERLERWMELPASPYGLVVVPAGQTLAAELARWAVQVAAEGRAAVAFVPISRRLATTQRDTAVALLEARLRHLRHAFGGESVAGETGQRVAEIEHYLCEDWLPGRPLLVVVDAADEAENWTGGHELHFPAHPGLGVKVLLSTRRPESLEDSGWQRLDQLFDADEVRRPDARTTVQTGGPSLLVGQLNAKDSRVVLIQGDNTATIHMGDEVRLAGPGDREVG
jgi:hypothetical protein